MVPQRPFVGQATGPWNDLLLLSCHPSPSLSTVMTLRTQPGNPSRPDRFPVLFYFCSFRVIYFFCVTASSSWTLELMAFPESTLLSLSTVLYFLSFSTLSHTFTSEFCNFLRNQSQGYASWATYKLELGLSGNWASRAGWLQHGLQRERVTVMARRPKISTLAYEDTCMYLYKTDAIAFPQRKAELTLIAIEGIKWW